MNGFTRFADALEGKIQIEVDSVVFADGEIQGPDLLDVGGDITNLYKASQIVAGHLHSGKGLAQIVKDLDADPMHKDPLRWNWLRQYQSQLAQIKPNLVAAFTATMDGMVKPPLFYKATK